LMLGILRNVNNLPSKAHGVSTKGMQSPTLIADQHQRTCFRTEI